MAYFVFDCRLLKDLKGKPRARDRFRANVIENSE
jgi:hypothetical protein